MPPHLMIEGSYNVRDLGGYPTTDGRATRAKVFIRAGNLDKVSPAAQQQLIEYGVKTVIDLRNEWETEHFPNVFSQSNKVTYINLPLIGDTLSNDAEWKAQSQTHTALADLYTQFLRHCRPQLSMIITAIAESEGTTLFHCHAGKDRTGIVAALLLALAGVPDDIVAEDYAQTTSYIAHLVTEWREKALAGGYDMERFAREVSANAETMLDLLRHLNEQYGGVREYLLGCGLDQKHLELLQARFVS
jgi:protein-tyrosine phosphatase